jgi:genome maintenance exonuclease 1
MNETIKRVYKKDGRRYYEVKDGNKTVIATLPSVTTVMGSMSDKSGLDAWRKRVGEEEADRISNLSMNRGTIMHRLIELYKPMSGTQQEKRDNLEDIAPTDEEILEITELENGQLYYNEAWKMFDKFWYNNSRFFGRVEKVIDSERFLWTVKGGGFAGTLDNVSELEDGLIKIIDYKNSRKPKREEWIQDYFRQAAAYWVAYWDRTGIKADGAEIWIANEIDLMPQCFSLTQEDLKEYYKSFMEIREAYREKYGE